MKHAQYVIPMMAAALAFSTGVSAESMSKEQYKSEMTRIKGEYESAKQRCDTLSGNAKDVCVAEAKGQEKVAKADLEAHQKNTEKARTDARVAKAEADYDVAKERCDDKSGNEKDVCVKDAKAALTRAKADAKADAKVSDARSEARGTATNARENAAENKRDADYKAAKERCDSYSGDAKDRCVEEAKARFGKS